MAIPVVTVPMIIPAARKLNMFDKIPTPTPNVLEKSRRVVPYNCHHCSLHNIVLLSCDESTLSRVLLCFFVSEQVISPLLCQELPCFAQPVISICASTVMHQLWGKLVAFEYPFPIHGKYGLCLQVSFNVHLWHTQPINFHGMCNKILERKGKLAVCWTRPMSMLFLLRYCELKVKVQFFNRQLDRQVASNNNATLPKTNTIAYTRHAFTFAFSYRE